jgi:rhomboid-related protein 1/2/3
VILINKLNFQDDDNSTEELDDDEDKLFCPMPIHDEWRQLFDKFDPEGFGEIPVDIFEAALDSRDFVQLISPGKLIILQDRLKQVQNQ